MSFHTLPAHPAAHTSLPVAAALVSYRLSMPQPQTHYIEVEMLIDDVPADSLLCKMPVWTPGSYLIREFSRKVESVRAYNTANQRPLSVQKTNKNTWAVATKGAQRVTIRYRVYAFELSVRTSFVDDTHATINPSSVCMYVEKHKNTPHHITIVPPKGWDTISTALDTVEKQAHTFVAPDYDLLVDSPIEVGNQRVIAFEAGGIPHELVIVGPHNGNETQMVADIQRMVDEERRMFDHHPCKRYVIFLLNTETLYGGLEHLNSTVLTYPRWEYAPESKYQRWLGLMSHEYFHLWNVKRLRPYELGPFDYDHENYTRLLWVAEGVTSYYDDLILCRTQLMKPDAYLGVVASNINNVSIPADTVDSVTDSSFDAWIKYYRPDENTANCCTNYYTKGSVLGTMLDLAIMQHTNGKKSLEDVMRYMYQEYYLRQQRGYHDHEFRAAVEMLCGNKLDDFFDHNVSGTEPLDYNRYLAYVGLQLVNTSANNRQSNLSLSTKTDNGKYTIATTPANGTAYKAGLNVGDELLAIDGYRINSDQQMRTVLDSRKVGSVVQVTVSRTGILRTIAVTLDNELRPNYRIERRSDATEQQTALYKKWLSIP